MKRGTIAVALLLSWACMFAQNDYFVQTSNPLAVIDSEEEYFIHENFPFVKLCDWTEGMKFMVIPSIQDMIIATFKSYETKKTVNNADLKYKIFEYAGVEEDEEKGLVKFIFDSEDKRYYYEARAKNLESLCSSKPNMEIKTLAYLGDIDNARKLLIGRVVYNTTSTLKIDDPNSSDGFRSVKVPQNYKLIVSDVGVGSEKAFPVKLILKDEKGNSYFWEVAFSKTNSGMSINDFVGTTKEKYFSYAFSFADAKQKTIESFESQYANKDIYPIVNLEADALISHDDMVIRTKIEILRYTPLVITSITKEDYNPSYTLHLIDRNGNTFTQDVTFDSDNIVIEKNLFKNIFAFGDIKLNFPYISEENWKLIARGQIKTGMNKDECRLSLGEPGHIRKKGKNEEYEEWIYQDRLLSFEKGLLVRSTK